MSLENAKWITGGSVTAPRFKKVFNVHDVETAKINICGLGFFEAKINGKTISSDLLVPAWSDYEPRPNRRLLYPIKDTFTHRVYYMEYDITELLKEGENELTVLLGNGWYNQRCRNVEGDLWYDDVKLCFDLCINNDVHIVSDETVLVSESRITFNNIFFGEKQDFTIKESFDNTAILIDAPKGFLEKQTCPADRVHRTIKPVKIASLEGKDIYDCGENITGWAVFTQCKSGKTTVRYAEEINENKSLNFTSCGGEGQIQSDEYVSDGNKHICRPKFTWHGFRYLELDGEHEELIVEVVYADVDITAEFNCSDDTLNQLFQNYIRTQVSNMHCGVPSDCPHRERLGYTGDGQLTCDAAMHVLNGREFYKKWIRDIADGQDINNGHIQHTAPFYGGGGGPGGWGCAIVAVPYFYYKNYCDKELLKEYYPNMKRWCSYMDSRSENGLVVREEEGCWCLGEWGFMEEILLPEPYINTYFYIKALMYMREISDVIGEDSNWICEKIEYLKSALYSEYYEKETNSVLGGVQGAEAFWCDLGMGNEEMLTRINNHYQTLGKFDTGIFGTEVLTRVLFENGYSDTAIMLMSSDKEGAFGYQIKNGGATTLWEYWYGEESHNQPMYGACVKYLLTGLLGIKKGTKLYVEPKPSSLLKNVCGKIEFDGKPVSVQYTYSDDKIVFAISAGMPVTFVWNNQEYEIAENTTCNYSFSI